MTAVLEELSVYADGSGLASEQFLRARKHLEKQHSVLSTMERFLDAHQDVMWGLAFMCCCVNPEIELWWQWYRGKRITDPREIARLWPDATWERKRDEYDEHKIDWWAEVDGVKLRLRAAESTRPAKLPPISGTVQI